MTVAVCAESVAVEVAKCPPVVAKSPHFVAPTIIGGDSQQSLPNRSKISWILKDIQIFITNSHFALLEKANSSKVLTSDFVCAGASVIWSHSAETWSIMFANKNFIAFFLSYSNSIFRFTSIWSLARAPRGKKNGGYLRFVDEASGCGPTSDFWVMSLEKNQMKYRTEKGSKFEPKLKHFLLPDCFCELKNAKGIKALV